MMRKALTIILAVLLVLPVFLTIYALVTIETYDCEELREKCALVQVSCNESECIYTSSVCSEEEELVLRACEYREE